MPCGMNVLRLWLPRSERASPKSAPVVHVQDDDGTVCEALSRLQPSAFANGGDRKTNNTPEMDVCDQLRF